MTTLIILMVAIALVGIIVLSAKSPFQKTTREQFLEQLAQFLEGTLEPILEEGYEHCYRIKFNFEDEEGVYEDLEKKGFKAKVYSAYLKIKTPSQLTLTFTEKKHSMKIRSDIFIASEVSSQTVEKRVRLQVPDYLSDLNVSANDAVTANALLEDIKIAGVLKRMKNVDDRGYSFLSIGIIDGIVSMEFHAQSSFKPNLTALRNDMASIDDYLDDMMIIVRKLKQLLK
jgi:hypothetical protein